MNRRHFVQTSLRASAASLLPFPMIARLSRTPAPLKILVLGGTNFLGPAVVEAAVVAGHTVTLFNRGLTNPGLFPNLEKLRGLRSTTASEESFAALTGRRWDVVVDVWPSDPTLVESAATRLGPVGTHYLYVSSIAAYDRPGFARPGLTEGAALNSWDAPIPAYSRGKAEGERRLGALVGGKLTVVRPGSIKGDRDDTPDLFAWLRRAQRGGRHIGPGSGEDHVQNVDVKDVARFLVLAMERTLLGAFNLTGVPMTFHEFIDRCKTATRSSAEFVWVPRDFLHEHGLDPRPFDNPTIPSYMGQFPFWHPEPERLGFYQISSAKAVDAGWTRRPFGETAFDCQWAIDAMGPAFQWTDELSPDTEAEVLGRWEASRRSR
jgi:nucleoside-diphosphate-sugar epimerase